MCGKYMTDRDRMIDIVERLRYRNTENAMKNKSSVRTNLSWLSLKDTFEKCYLTKNIN